MSRTVAQTDFTEFSCDVPDLSKIILNPIAKSVWLRAVTVVQ